MISLFIDTSSVDVSIAILRDSSVLASVTKSIPNQHSVYTVSFIDDVLKKANLGTRDVQKIMVVVGPGSFTGLRIGVTIAKVYGYLENIDVIPVSSLKMRSLSCSHDYCLSIIDAHHDHFYMGLYDKDNSSVIEEKYASLDEVRKIISEYNPSIVSDMDGKIDDIDYFKQELDFSKIYSFYKDVSGGNVHFLKPNYLKLPQVLEERHD